MFFDFKKNIFTWYIFNLKIVEWSSKLIIVILKVIEIQSINIFKWRESEGKRAQVSNIENPYMI